MPARGTKKPTPSEAPEQLAIPIAPTPALGPASSPTLASILACLTEPRVLALHRVFGSDLRDRAGGRARVAAVAAALTLTGCQQAKTREPGDIRIALAIGVGIIALVIGATVYGTRERRKRREMLVTFAAARGLHPTQAGVGGVLGDLTVHCAVQFSSNRGTQGSRVKALHLTVTTARCPWTAWPGGAGITIMPRLDSASAYLSQFHYGLPTPINPLTDHR